MQFYPSILTDSKREAQDQLLWIGAYPSIRTVQVDVIDGHFVDNITISPTDFPDIDFGELSMDLHLMVEEPLDYVYEAIEHKEYFAIRSIIAQVERMSSQEIFLDTVTKNEWQAGLSLDLFTPLEAIDEASWQAVDIVQLMAIEAGFQGQSFNPLLIEKIKNLVTMRAQLDRNFEIIIDGGVKLNIIEDIRRAGADSFVVGSGLWQAQDKAALDSAVQAYTE